MDLAALLVQVPLFSTLAEETRRALGSLAEPLDLPSGRCLYQEA